MICSMEKKLDNTLYKADLGQRSCRIGYNYQNSVIINRLLLSFLKEKDDNYNKKILHGVEFIQDYFQQHNDKWLFFIRLKLIK